MAAGIRNFTITRGDSIEFPITIKDSLGAAIDITSAVITSDVKTRKNATTPLVSFTITKTNAAQGQFSMSLTSVQTTALPVTNDAETNILYYDLEFAWTPTNIKTEMAGTMTVIQEITI